MSVGITAIICVALCIWLGRRLRLPTCCTPCLGSRKQRKRVRDEEEEAISTPRRSRNSRKHSSDESAPAEYEEDPEVGAPLPSNFLDRRVVLVGLSKAALNGSCGTATIYDAASERIVVALDSGGSVKVRLVNLQLADSEAAQAVLGHRVRLHGLSTQDLNARHGTAVRFDEDTGRVVVEFEGNAATVVKVKLQNLEKAKSGRAPAAKPKVPKSSGRSRVAYDRL